MARVQRRFTLDCLIKLAVVRLCQSFDREILNYL